MAQFTTDVVVLSGDAVPDGDGSFDFFVAYSLNDMGEVAFRAGLSGTSGGDSQDSGIYVTQGNSLAEVVREGDPSPNGNGNYVEFNNINNVFLPLISNDGQVVFFGELTGTTGGSDDAFGIFSGNGINGLQKIVREGDAAPDGNGTFASFNISGFNSVGQAAFRGNLRGTVGGGDDNRGIYRGDALGTPVQIARMGQAAPDGNGILSSMNSPFINDVGQVAFIGEIAGTIAGAADGRVIFRGDGQNGLLQIARQGDAAPDGNGTYSPSIIHSVNNAGSVTFTAGITGTIGGSDDNRGIFRSNGTSQAVQIVRKGESAPDGNGVFAAFNNLHSNLGNDTVFLGTLSGTNEGFGDDQGVFLADGFSSPRQIAREGEAAPRGSGTFGFFFDLEVNEAGQVAFRSFLNGDSMGLSSGTGIFFYDDQLGLMKIARQGDVFLGSTISDVSFVTASDKPSSLNCLGQIAYRFELADGRQGIAVATLVPEPSSLLLALMAASFGFACRR